MGVHMEILACIVRFIFCRIEYTECKNAASCRRSIVYVYTCRLNRSRCCLGGEDLGVPRNNVLGNGPGPPGLPLEDPGRYLIFAMRPFVKIL